MFEHVQLAKIEQRLTAIESSLNLLHMTAQNILDATQNAVSAIQGIPAAVTALVNRIPVPTDPTATVLTAAETQTVVDGLTNIATSAQSFVDELNAILPAPTA